MFPCLECDSLTILSQNEKYDNIYFTSNFLLSFSATFPVPVFMRKTKPPLTNLAYWDGFVLQTENAISYLSLS